MDIDEKEGALAAEAGPSGTRSGAATVQVQTNGYHAHQKEEERVFDDQEWPLFYPVELGGGESGHASRGQHVCGSQAFVQRTAVTPSVGHALGRGEAD